MSFVSAVKFFFFTAVEQLDYNATLFNFLQAFCAYRLLNFFDLQIHSFNQIRKMFGHYILKYFYATLSISSPLIPLHLALRNFKLDRCCTYLRTKLLPTTKASSQY